MKKALAAALAVLAVVPIAWGQAKRPNILFAISDDQSAMHAGAYGDTSNKTPAFDRIAGEGVLFNYAYAAAPSCAPSRSAILTGRHIWEVEEGGILLGVLRSKFTVFTQLIQDGGYELGATGKTWSPGRLDGWELADIYGKVLQDHEIPQKDRRPGLRATDYAANFDQFMDERDASKPFFFWLGTSEPHQRYDVGGWKKAGKKLEDANLPPWLPDTPEVRGEILDYGLEIEHFDNHVGRAIARLEKEGQLDNTLIIVTSDHGNPLPRSKCNLYDGGTRVPLAIRWPGEIPAGRKVDDFVGLTDIAPTILDVTGIEQPAEMSGNSLWPVLQSSKSGLVDPARSFYVTAFERHTVARRNAIGYPMRALRTHKYALIRNYEPDRWPAGDPDYYAPPQGFFGDVDRGVTKTYLMEHSMEDDVRPYYLMSFGRRPAVELFDMEKDPHQLHNVADDPAYRETKQRLIWQLEAFLRDKGDPRMRGDTPWDTYEFTSFGVLKMPKWRTEGMPSPLPK